MVRKLILSITLPALLTLGVFAGADPTYKDYNHRMARISYIQNNLAFAHGDEEWSGASINTPLQPGDRLYAPAQGRAEIQFDDGSALRIGSNTEVTLARLDDDHVQIRLAIGIATLRVNSSTYFEVNTPSAAVTADEKGTYRIEVQENGGVDVKVRKGRVTVYNKALEKHVRKGEHIIVYNPDGADFEMAQFSGKDEWDQWNDRRDAAMASRNSARYLPDSAFMGAYDLDGYGRWTTVSGYGDCWIPSVAYGWSPYRVGRWVYRPFWGWTWVSYEPWGWLPYHYGRWFYAAPYGWAWYPGSRHSFYFWSPGLVRFSYGRDWVGWCPLGPRDYVSFSLFFGRSYYRSYAVHMDYGTSGYHQLRNYGAPNSVVYVNHNTFINQSVTNVYNNNTYVTNRRVTSNTVQLPPNAFTSGTVVKDHQLPFKPTGASFSPNPAVAVKPPRPEISSKPVFLGPTKPMSPPLRTHDAAAGGLSVIPQTEKGTRAVLSTPKGTVKEIAPASRPLETRTGGREGRPISSPADTSKGGDLGRPISPSTKPAVGSGKPLTVKPGDFSAAPPTTKPSRTDSVTWPTAPPRRADKPATAVQPMPSLQPSRVPDKPSAPATPPSTVKPGRAEPLNRPSAPARTIERPTRQEHPNPPPSIRPAPKEEKHSAPVAPPREERRQKPSAKENSYMGSDSPAMGQRPTRSGDRAANAEGFSVSRGYVQAPSRNRNPSPAESPGAYRHSSMNDRGGHQADPAPAREPSSARYNPPEARPSRNTIVGGDSPGHERSARSNRGEWGSGAPPKYSAPSAHSSPPPARLAPSYDHSGSGRSSAPSYHPSSNHESGGSRHGGNAVSGGGRIESGGKSGERRR